MNAQQLLERLLKIQSDGNDLNKLELWFDVENDSHIIDGMFLHNTSNTPYIEFYHKIR